MFAWREHQVPQKPPIPLQCHPVFLICLLYWECSGLPGPEHFWEKLYRLHVIHPDQRNGILRVSHECAFGPHCLLLSSLIPSVFYPLVCAYVCAQRSGTHLVRIHWKLFCRNEHEKNAHKLYFMMWNARRLLLLWKIPNHFGIHSPHIQYIRSNYSFCWEFFMCHFPSFSFLFCRNMPKVV